MNNLDVISVNLWQILISLANLVILFLLLKKFLFKPVRDILAKRQREIDELYEKADGALSSADESRKKWEETLSGAKDEADAILKNATDNAKFRGDKMVEEAKAQAESVIRVAKTEAELEIKRAKEGFRHEILEVSSALTEKMLEREINVDDHKALVDSFIKDIGDGND